MKKTVRKSQFSAHQMNSSVMMDDAVSGIKLLDCQVSLSAYLQYRYDGVATVSRIATVEKMKRIVRILEILIENVLMKSTHVKTQDASQRIGSVTVKEIVNVEKVIKLTKKRKSEPECAFKNVFQLFIKCSINNLIEYFIESLRNTNVSNYKLNKTKDLTFQNKLNQMRKCLLHLFFLLLILALIFQDEMDCDIKCDVGQFSCPSKIVSPRERRQNYCILQKHICDGNKDCIQGEDEENCPAVHSCASNSKCQQLCVTSSAGKEECSCKVGYLLGLDGFSCDDINECEFANNPCSQTCNNTVGGFM